MRPDDILRALSEVDDELIERAAKKSPNPYLRWGSLAAMLILVIGMAYVVLHQGNLNLPEQPETEASETDAPEIEAPETDAPETEAPETEAPETEAPETEAPAEELIGKVALVTDVGTVDDKAYNQACWQGVEAWCSANGVDYNYYRPTEDSTDARLLSVSQAVAEGANVVILPGYSFGAVLIEAQDAYPDVYFVAVDVGAGDLTYDYVEYYEPAPNTVCLTFAEEQAGYLAGYAAVKDGYTKLGFLGGMAIPSVIRYGYGFLQGADTAAAEMGVDIDINYTYTGQFYGSPESTAKMDSWYESGTEVVFACGGSIYSSAVEAASKHDGKVIGVNVDQTHLDECIITSATKDLQAVVETTLSDLQAGAWDTSYSAQVKHLSLFDGDFVGIPTDEESWKLNTFSIEEYEYVKTEIAEGIRFVDNTANPEVLPRLSENTTVELIN